MKTVIVDLDGTLALIDHRLHYIKGANKDYDSFYNACDKDAPNQRIINLVNVLECNGYFIEIMTGRSDIVKDKTVAWLDEHSVRYDHLTMREYGDHTPDFELKKKWFFNSNTLRKEIVFVLEDRKRVVDMWRSMGITCLQVADGNF